MNMTSNEPNIPVRELTDALATVQQEDTPLNRASVLVALATSTVTVMLDKPWDGHVHRQDRGATLSRGYEPG